MSEVLHSLRHLSVEEVLLPLLIQLGIIILVARAFGMLFRRLGQPSVIGETAAGLVLGPSLLGYFFPGISDAIFHPAVAGVDPRLFDQLLRWVFTGFSQLGLIFLLFLVGLEFDFGHLRSHGRTALAISLTGLALPFALGLGLAPLLRPFLETEVSLVGFTLFLGTALSITAIPVLARIMLELNITRTRLGTITISSAAVDDACGWILLATVAAVVHAERGEAQFNPVHAAVMLAEALAFGLFMVFLARPLLCRWARYVMHASKGELSLNALSVLLFLLFGCAIVTNLIGIFAVFGAFLLGAVLSGESEFRAAVNRRLRDFVVAFFLPIFFAYTGLRTNVGSLESLELWLLCGLVSAVSIAGKFGGCTLAAWLGGCSFREAACIGAMMNTRGLMELVVINLGKDLGVIPDSVFCMLVLMAMVTTMMTTPLLLRLMRGTELEPYILGSAFMGNATPPSGAEA